MSPANPISIVATGPSLLEADDLDAPDAAEFVPAPPRPEPSGQYVDARLQGTTLMAERSWLGKVPECGGASDRC